MRISITRRTTTFLVAAGMMLAAAGCASAADTVQVGMTNTLKFTPHTVTVHVGDTVEWHNGSALTHTVTDVPKLASKQGDATLPRGAKPFNSGYLNPGQSYSHTFTVPGTYHYFCIPHEATGMVATVVVKPKH